MIEWIKSLTTLQLIAQIEGLFALACFVISYQQKKHKIVMVFQTLGCFLWVIHTAMLKAPAGTLINFLCMCRNIVYYYKAKGCKWASSKGWLYGQLIVFPLASVASMAFFHENWFAFFPAIASMIGAVSLSKDSTFARQGQLFVAPFWFVYDFIFMSIPGLISDGVNLISTIIGILRIDLKLKKEKEESKEH